MPESPTSYAILGTHRIADGRFDAVDALLSWPSGDVVVFGLRTFGYLATLALAAPEVWADDYRPLAVTADTTTPRHWDFNDVFWLGPDAWPCVAWCNAESMSEHAIVSTFAPPHTGRLLAGPNGRGLPTPTDVGITVPPDITWNPLTAATAE